MNAYRFHTGRVVVSIGAAGVVLGLCVPSARAQNCPIPRYIYSSDWRHQADGSLVPKQRSFAVNNAQHTTFFSPVLSYGVNAVVGDGGVPGWGCVRFRQVQPQSPIAVPGALVQENQVGCTSFVNTGCECFPFNPIPAGVYALGPEFGTLPCQWSGRGGTQFLYVDPPGMFAPRLNDYSLDPLSPEVVQTPVQPVPRALAGDIIYHPDIQNQSGTWRSLGIPSAQLGLLPSEDLTSFSRGEDWPFALIGESFFDVLIYSVTRPTVGAPGSVIEAQAAPQPNGNGAAGDTFEVTFWNQPGTGVFGPVGPPALRFDAPQRGLTAYPVTPPVLTESNIDGLDSGENGTDGTNFQHYVYYCVDAAAAARLSVVLGVPIDEATVLYKPAIGGPGVPPAVYATPAMLGLVPGDVIDALAVYESSFFLTLPPVPPGRPDMLEPNDYVYASLAPGSPSAGPPLGLGTASIIEVFPRGLVVPPPPPFVVVTPAMLGLLPTDDLDAISMEAPPTIGACCPPWTPRVPPDGCSVIARTACTSQGGRFMGANTSCCPATLGGGTCVCIADFNNSCRVSVQDIFDFLAAYFAGDPRADVNGGGGGVVTVQDIFDFLAAYFGGC